MSHMFPKCIHVISPPSPNLEVLETLPRQNIIRNSRTPSESGNKPDPHIELNRKKRLIYETVWLRYRLCCINPNSTEGLCLAGLHS